MKVIGYLQLLRIPAIFTVISNILAAHFIATQDNSIQWGNLFLLIVISVAIYLSGMVLNDCYDFDEDSIYSPHRPLPAGHIELNNAWRLGWGLMLMGLLLAFYAGVTQFTVTLVLALLVILYNGYLKQTVIAPLLMGSCRYFNWILGFSFVPFKQEAFIFALPIFFYISALTYLSTEEATIVKNRSPLVVCVIGMILCLLLLLSFLIPGPVSTANTSIAILISLFILNVAYVLWQTNRDYSSQQIQKAVKTLIMGVIPLDALIVLTQVSYWQAFIILLLLIPGWFLSQRLRVT